MQYNHAHVKKLTSTTLLLSTTYHIQTINKRTLQLFQHRILNSQDHGQF